MDAPATAEEKLVADWREGRKLQLPEDLVPRVIVESSGDPRIDVVVWGDYLEAGTIMVDEMIRASAQPGSGIRYTFRHYPFDQDCNPHLSRTHHPGACFASRLVEAAGVMGGEDSYRDMHEYLMQGRGAFVPSLTPDAAMAGGLPTADLVLLMKAPEVEDAVRDDVEAGKKLGLRGIPVIVINGRKVPRWKLDDEPRLDLFFAALSDSSPSP